MTLETKRSGEREIHHNEASSTRRALIAFGIGLGAQYTLTHGFPLLGVIGYGVAIWLFVSRIPSYLEDKLGDQLEDIDRKSIQSEIAARWDDLRVIRQHWRKMTIYEIYSFLFQSQSSSIDFPFVESQDD